MRRRAFVRGAVVTVAATASPQGALRSAPRMRDDRIDAALRALRGGVISVAIAHVRDDVYTHSALSLGDVETARIDVTRRTVRAAATLGRIVALLDRAAPRLAGGKPDYDARWSLRFATRHGAVLVACDRFARSGEIDGHAVRFTGERIEERLAALLPNFQR